MKEKIRSNIAKWDKERTLGEYAREHFSQLDDKRGKSKISNVLDNIYSLAVSAESEDIQLKAAKEIRETLALGEVKEAKQENTQINFYTNVSEQINESAAKLIAANVKQDGKKGVLDLI